MKNISEIKFISIGITDFELSKIDKIENWGNKPSGGFWTSPYTPAQDFVSQWQKFIITEDLTSKISNESIIFNLKKDAKGYIINSQKDLIDLINEVGHTQIPTFDAELYLDIDFEVAAEKYDYIYLTEQGTMETYCPEKNRKYNLNDWSIESVLIMNAKIIENVEKIELKNHENVYQVA